MQLNNKQKITLMKKKEALPGVMNLSPEEFSALQERVAKNKLYENDLLLFGQLLIFVAWLQNRLVHARITIFKLRMLFGITQQNGKQAIIEESSEDEDDDQNQNGTEDSLVTNDSESTAPQSTENTPSDEKKSKERKNGRLTANHYLNKKVIPILHEQYTVGQKCPTECGGKLYSLEAGSVIRITGQADHQVTHYLLERLRCTTCGVVYTAALPKEAGAHKYDEHFKSQLAVKKYYAGTPFYTNEKLFKMIGLPLSDATQWTLIQEAADCVKPILGVLAQQLAQAELLYYDDTWLRILSQIAKVKSGESTRKGCYTTAVLGIFGGHQITLYYSGINHAGENIKQILALRPSNLPPVKTMSDALSHNLTHEVETLTSHCLAHGLRKFRDLEAFFPKKCEVILKALRCIYHNDNQTQQMTEKERLTYHQKHSQPVLDKLKEWMEQQLATKQVEPNSHLGQSMNYMLKRWDRFTNFLRVEGVPLDNNICERALKLAIRIRKVAMFHRTEKGASIAGLMLSLIQTAVINDINPVAYLTACQRHKTDVSEHPERWLPWNYHENLTTNTQMHQAA